MIKPGSRGEGPIIGIFKSVLNELVKFHNALRCGRLLLKTVNK